MIFNHAATSYPERLKVFENFCVQYPEDFTSTEYVALFMRHILVPKHRRWAYSFNEKCGSSSVKRFLFEMEFGSKFSVELTAPNDINPEIGVHRLVNAGVFRLLVGTSNPRDLLDNALRLTVVRHPTSRAISSFFYLCLTHDRAHIWMSDDRLRMNALVGFDWEHDLRTPAGFEKFLRYIDASPKDSDQYPVNAHWRPQIDNIRPKVFRPDIIGRTENLTAFFREVAERLDYQLPSDWKTPQTNQNTDTLELSSFMTQTNRALIQKIYARDFEWLGYDPDDALS